MCSDDVALAGDKSRQELVAPDRNEHRPHFYMLVFESLVGGELFVEFFLKHPDGLNGESALYALIEEIDALAVDGQHADDPPLDHPVQITGPEVLHLGEIDGESLASRF